MEILSKNYPNYAVGIKNGTEAYIIQNSNGRNQQFKIVNGICGVDNSISFESIENPGHFLKHSNFLISLSNEENSEIFKRDASFHPRTNTFNTVISFVLNIFSNFE